MLLAKNIGTNENRNNTTTKTDVSHNLRKVAPGKIDIANMAIEIADFAIKSYRKFLWNPFGKIWAPV